MARKKKARVLLVTEQTGSTYYGNRPLRRLELNWKGSLKKLTNLRWPHIKEVDNINYKLIRLEIKNED